MNKSKEYQIGIENNNKLLLEKENNIKELEETIKDLKQKLEDTSKKVEDEINIYSQKQILRDNKLLMNENKIYKETITKLEKEALSFKNKDAKIMKFLFVLQKKGIPISEAFEEVNNTDKQTQRTNESISMNDSIYTPLTLDPGKTILKPTSIPKLNLGNINNSIYNFDSDDTAKKKVKKQRFLF